jgi:hypothetical protein
LNTESKTSYYLSTCGKKFDVLDEAWDAFIDYVGERKLRTPLTKDQFEEILIVIDKNNRFMQSKKEILYSFQYDSYAWPLVEKERGR